MDSVELVMEIADEFGIEIPDGDAERVQTVGQLVDYVVGQIAPAAVRPECATARAFYDFRRVVMHVCRVPRRSVRPGTRVARLFDRRPVAAWPEVARAVGLDRAYSFDGAVPVYPPAALATVGDVVRRIEARWPYGCLRGTAFEEEVFAKVRKIVSEQTGVDAREIHRGINFVRDLGF